MRSELNEIVLIDQWLLGQLGESEKRHFEARLLTDEAFAEKAEAQRVCHRLIRNYARAKERLVLETIFMRLIEETGFAHQLNTIFT